MRVKLYLNLSEPHRVNKNLSLIAELEGNLRDGSSVVNPSVLIDSETNLSLVNYIEIEEFGRKYFVNNISVPVTRLWQLDCHVDVLSTYYDFYKELPCVVARNEKQYNLFLPDDRFLVNANRNYQTRVFPNAPQTSGGSSYVVTIAGGAQAET